MKRFAMAAAVIMVLGGGARAQGPAGGGGGAGVGGVARAQGPAEEGVVSGMRVREVQEGWYFHATVETTMGKIGESVGPKTGELEKVHPGVPVVVMRGAGSDPAAPVLVQVGTVVPKGTEGTAGFSVSKLEKFRCATVIYGGP